MDGIDLTLNDAALWSLVIGSLLPMVIAFFQQPQWSDQVRSIVTPIVCVVVAVATVWINGQFDTANLVRTFLIIFLSAQLTYRTYWRPSGITKAIEDRTSKTA